MIVSPRFNFDVSSCCTILVFCVTITMTLLKPHALHVLFWCDLYHDLFLVGFVLLNL